jgi:hypothetical protein
MEVHGHGKYLGKSVINGIHLGEVLYGGAWPWKILGKKLN